MEHKAPIATLTAAECLAQSIDKLGEELEKTNEFLEGAIDAVDKLTNVAVSLTGHEAVHRQSQHPQSVTTPKRPTDHQADPQTCA